MEAWWTANVVQPFEELLHSYNTSSNRQSADAVKKRIKLAQTTGLCNLERNLNWTRFPDFIFDVVGDEIDEGVVFPVPPTPPITAQSDFESMIKGGVVAKT